MPTPPRPLWFPNLNFDGDQLSQLQSSYAQEAMALWQQGLQDNPKLNDRRFTAQAWQHNPVSAFSAALYLLNTRTLMAMTEALDTDDKTRARIRFAVEQWAAAAAPSNFLALNAEAPAKSH